MNIKLLSIAILLLFVSTTYAKTSGEELFKQCKACHTLTEDRLVGPGLAGVTEKRDREWLKSWITSSTKLIASGDADAKAIFDEYKIPMQDFDFSDEDMETLINYMGGIDEKAVEEVAVEEVTEKEVVKKTTEIDEDTKETTKVVEVEKESDFKKALKNRPLTRRLFELSLLLLFGVLIAAITIYRKSKKL